MSNKNLGRWQAWWRVFLSRFKLELSYQPWKTGGKPDALIRWYQDRLDPTNEAYQNRMTMLRTLVPLEKQIKKLHASRHLLEDILREWRQKTFFQQFEKPYQSNSFSAEILRMLGKGTCHSRKIIWSECTELESRLIYQACVWVPECSELCHWLDTEDGRRCLSSCRECFIGPRCDWRWIISSRIVTLVRRVWR